ncbi:hypothetical protein RJT17_00175 [Streptomyces sp. P5-A9]|uniref:hypothetical protein n=1 Tax=Streptomyces sp. P5-A9 TaxID=3071730 RepID=UPI002FC6F9A9
MAHPLHATALTIHAATGADIPQLALIRGIDINDTATTVKIHDNTARPASLPGRATSHAPPASTDSSTTAHRTARSSPSSPSRTANNSASPRQESTTT